MISLSGWSISGLHGTALESLLTFFFVQPLLVRRIQLSLISQLSQECGSSALFATEVLEFVVVEVFLVIVG